jgi:hypothetical protein
MGCLLIEICLETLIRQLNLTGSCARAVLSLATRKLANLKRVLSHLRLFAGEMVLCNACATTLYIG